MLFPFFLQSALQNFSPSMELFHHSFFLCAQTIATSALSRTPLVFPHLSFHELSHYLRHLKVCYHVSYVAFSFQYILVCNFFSSSFLKPNTQHHNIRHFLQDHSLYMLTLSLSDTTLLHTILAMSLNFFHPQLILALSASCTLIQS